MRTLRVVLIVLCCACFGQQRRTVSASVSDSSVPAPARAPLTGLVRVRCRCTRSLVTSDGRQSPHVDSGATDDGEGSVGTVSVISRAPLLPRELVVAWVIIRLRGGRAHAPLNVAAPDASHHLTVCSVLS